PTFVMWSRRVGFLPNRSPSPSRPLRRACRSSDSPRGHLMKTVDANHMTDTPSNGDAFSKQLLVAMLAFRDGDFAVRLPVDLIGVNGKIADAFNDIVGVSERRARETARVSLAVGKEGKLKQRMAVPDVTGG